MPFEGVQIVHDIHMRISSSTILGMTALKVFTSQVSEVLVQDDAWRIIQCGQ